MTKHARRWPLPMWYLLWLRWFSGIVKGVLSQSFALFQYSIESAKCLPKKATGRVSNMTIDFKGSHYPKDVILYAAFFYVSYGVSYRDLEEIMPEPVFRLTTPR